MQPSSEKPTRTATAPGSRAAQATFVLAVIASTALIVGGLLQDTVGARACWIAAVPLPMIIDALLERRTWRAGQARALRREMAGKDLPGVHENPKAYLARQSRIDPGRAERLGITSADYQPQ